MRLALLAACSLLVACFSDDDVDACTRGRALTAKVHVVLLSNTMLPFGPSRARNRVSRQAEVPGSIPAPTPARRVRS